MASFGQTVLVTGATGKQGGTLARLLLRKGHRVRALVRKNGAPAAVALKNAGAELALGTFDDRASLQRAAMGVNAVFAMSTPFEGGVDTEVRQGLAIADAAKVAGVSHLVFSSVAGATQETGIPHFDSKARIEKHIRALGVPHTIIAPVFFMENFLSAAWLAALKDGKLPMALPADRKLQQVALEDLAQVAAQVIERRRDYLDRRIEIASDELTGEQAAAALSRAADRPVQYSEVPVDQLRSQNEDLAKMFDWFDKVGYAVDIPALRKEFPSVTWHDFDAWARAQNLSALKREAVAPASGRSGR